MPFNQPLAGKIEPAASSWRSATAGQRAKFYDRAGDQAVEEKRKELRRAIGSNGRQMKPRKQPRRDGANGPVLIPHEDQSRTARLLDFKSWQGGLTLFWHSGVRKGTRTPWGTILGYHAEGKVKGAPKRDVRLSKRGITAVRKAMELWWGDLIEAAERQARTAKAVEKTPKKTGLFRKKAPKHVPAPGSNRPLTPAQEALAKRHPSLRKFLRNPEEDF